MKIMIYMTAIPMKIVSIPCQAILRVSIKFLVSNNKYMRTSYYNKYGTIERIIPPANTEAICPATFAETACINK